MASSCSMDHNNSSGAENTEHSNVCVPCDIDGTKLKAMGYCVNCKEYLCQQCFDAHLIPTPMRGHKLLDVAETTGDVQIQLCSKHEDKSIEYHCPTHSFLGCSSCFTKHQKTCKDTIFIPEVLENFTNTNEYQEFTEMLTDITTKCTNIASEVKDKTETLETRHAERIAPIKRFKKQVIEAFDQHEEELVEKANIVKQEEAAKLTEVSDKCNAIITETQKTASTMEILQNKQQICGLYIAMVQSRENLLSMKNDVHAVSIKTRDFTFLANKDLLKSKVGLGRLRETDTVTKVEHIQDINVKFKTEYLNCRLVSSVLLAKHKLALADYNNGKVKLFDTRKSKFTSELKLSSGPYGMCQVSEEEVAVTLPTDGKVAIVSTRRGLNLYRAFKVDGTCRGVGYCDGKFVVSYDTNKVEVIIVYGMVLNKFETDGNGKSLFNRPNQLAVNPENNLIYVSNYGSHNIVCMKLDGTVMAKYEDSDLNGPWQVVFDYGGMAFVCGQASHNIHQITADCRKVKVLLTGADGLDIPESISYSRSEGRLYIGLQRSDILKVFQITHAEL